MQFKDIIGQSITVSLLLADGEFRYFNGIITRFSQQSSGGESAGIHDLLGNVSEWTTTTTGKSKRFRIFGGSFKDLLGSRSAPFVVNRMAATARSAEVGFRIARALRARSSAVSQVEFGSPVVPEVSP